MAHAYEHLVGRIVGIRLGTLDSMHALIVKGKVLKPFDWQNDNYIHVGLENGVELTVKYMDTYGEGFVNGVVNPDIAAVNECC